MKLILLMILAFSSHQTHDFSHSSGKITRSQIKTVELAIEDEVYDYGYEKDYAGTGKNGAASGDKWISGMPLYIEPRIKDGGGTVIYTLKPYGEIYRAFYLRDDGLVVLDGDPEFEFPPTDVSFKTKYMNSDRLARLKRNWLHVSFSINTDPDIKTVRQAAVREKERTGYSFWESEVLPHLSHQ